MPPKKPHKGSDPNRDEHDNERFEFSVLAYDMYDPKGVKGERYSQFLYVVFAADEHIARRSAILATLASSRFVKDISLNAAGA